MAEIKSIEKDKRKDISNYTAILDNGNTFSIEAESKVEAEKKIKEHLKLLELDV